MAAFKIDDRGCGKAQYHPRMRLALLVYCYANGIFSSRRIERATHHDIVSANSHPDHDTIAALRAENKAAFEAAFLEVLVITKEMELLQVGAVPIDATKLDANASKIRSVRFDQPTRGLRARKSLMPCIPAQAATL